MKISENRFTWIIFAVLALALALGVLNSVHPSCLDIPSRDSGVFLYTARVILNGGVPYLDSWDHKPPIVFFIDAFGLWLSRGAYDGVRWVELGAIAGALWIGLQITRRAFGRLAAIGSQSLWAISLIFLLQGGNFTTEYTLPLQFAAFWLFLKMEKERFRFFPSYLLGLVMALMFFTKQNTIGIGVAIAIYLLIQRLRQRAWRQLLFEFLTILGGFFTLAGIIVLYFAVNQGLDAFWNAAFVFNFAYVSNTDSFSAWLNTLLLNMQFISSLGLLPLAFTGFAFGLAASCNRSARLLPAWPLVAVALIDLPLEIVLANLSDDSYRHYFISLLPVLSILAGFILWLALKQLAQINFSRELRAAGIAVLVTLIAIQAIPEYQSRQYCPDRSQAVHLVDYLRKNTTQKDTIFFWGAETRMNFVTNRKSPSRYTYLYPLYIKGSASEAMQVDFLDDLLENPPKYLVNTYNKEMPFLEFPVESAEITRRLECLKARYTLVEGINGWDVYQYNTCTNQRCKCGQ
jgi:hypothetical protein